MHSSVNVCVCSDLSYSSPGVCQSRRQFYIYHASVSGHAPGSAFNLGPDRPIDGADWPPGGQGHWTVPLPPRGGGRSRIDRRTVQGKSGTRYLDWLRCTTDDIEHVSYNRSVRDFIKLVLVYH